MTSLDGIPELPGPDAPTFWNGEPCMARQVIVTVADDPRFEAYWARPYVGSDREAVEVRYAGRVFYLDDEGHAAADRELEILLSRGLAPVQQDPGCGWAKVTLGMGSPRYAHRQLAIEPDSVRPREPEDLVV